MAELLEYKCPCCGGRIEFDSSLQKMSCPFCDTAFELETLKEYDADLKDEQPDDMDWDTSFGGEWQDDEGEGISVYTCNSCGGEIVADNTTAAASCPFCDNPIVMTRRLTGDLKPDVVIPFKLDKQAAKAALTRHLHGKPLLPKVFKDENHIDEIKGLYVPFWLFDADAKAHIRYKATKVRTWSDSRYDYIETKHYLAVRKGNIGFNHVPVDGSTKMADDLMESIEPFDFSDAVDFQTAYLSGYLADRYDVTAEESIDRANERVKRSTEDSFSATVNGYSSVVPESSNIQLQNGKANYALYPVWLLNTSWKGDRYTFAMNGQTGKFVGDLPVDKGAFWRWFAGITAISGVVIYGLMWLLFMLF